MGALTPTTEKESRSTGQEGRSPLLLLPAALVALVVVLLPLSAAFDLPLERQVKDLVGVKYDEPPCAPIRHRGSFGAWRHEGLLPTPVDEGRAARAGDYAYLVGGVVTPIKENLGRSTSAFRRYDLRTGRVESLPPLPRRLNHVGVAARGGGVYVVGGWVGDRFEALSESTSETWRYDIESERWQELPPLSVARGALGVAFVGDTLYAVGGRDGSRSFDTVEAYDPERGSWAEVASLPGERDHLGVAAAGGSLYAAAGRPFGGEELRDFLRYDPGRDRWISLPPLPEGTSGVNLERIGQELVVTGGEDSEQAHSTGRTVAFNPATDRWRELPPSPRPKHGYASVGFRGRLYVLGGARCAGGSAPTATVESLRLSNSR